MKIWCNKKMMKKGMLIKRSFNDTRNYIIYSSYANFMAINFPDFFKTAPNGRSGLVLFVPESDFFKGKTGHTVSPKKLCH